MRLGRPYRDVWAEESFIENLEQRAREWDRPQQVITVLANFQLWFGRSWVGKHTWYNISIETVERPNPGPNQPREIGERLKFG